MAPPAEADEAGGRREKAKTSDGKAALEDAMAVLDRSGCAAAMDKLDRVGTEFAGQASAASAMWEAARCHEKLGDKGKATELYQALRESETYGDRAKGELADMEQSAPSNATNAQAAGGAGVPAAAARAPAKAASKVAADSNEGFAGPPGGAKAAPAPAAAPKAAAPEKAIDAAF